MYKINYCDICYNSNDWEEFKGLFKGGCLLNYGIFI